MSFNGYGFFGVDLTFAEAYTLTALNCPKVGTRIQTDDGKEFVFCEAGAILVAGNFLTRKIGDSSTNVPFVVEHCDAATEQPIGIATVAATDGQGLWVQTKGLYASANVATSTAAGAMVIGSSTAGRAAAVANNADEVVIPIAQVLVEAASNAANVALMSSF